MLSINKCFDLNLKNCIFNNKNNINYILSQIIRCYSTKSSKSKPFLSDRKSLLTAKQSEIRCLSSKSIETDLKPKTSPIVESQKPLTKAKTASKPIGIIGLDTEEFFEKNLEKKDMKWTPIYSFPLIMHCRAFCRLKLIQTVITCTIVPMTAVLYAFDMSTLDTLQKYSLVSMFALFSMFFFGQVFRRLVGRAYISDDESLVRLSHLSFFGNRIDENIEISDIVPLTDNNSNLNDFYTKIERYSNEDFLYMSLKFGGILNREAFEKVFGQDSSDISYQKF